MYLYMVNSMNRRGQNNFNLRFFFYNMSFLTWNLSAAPDPVRAWRNFPLHVFVIAQRWHRWENLPPRPVLRRLHVGWFSYLCSNTAQMWSFMSLSETRLAHRNEDVTKATFNGERGERSHGGGASPAPALTPPCCVRRYCEIWRVLMVWNTVWHSVKGRGECERSQTKEKVLSSRPDHNGEVHLDHQILRVRRPVTAIYWVVLRRGRSREWEKDESGWTIVGPRCGCGRARAAMHAGIALSLYCPTKAEETEPGQTSLLKTGAAAD